MRRHAERASRARALVEVCGIAVAVLLLFCPPAPAQRSSPGELPFWDEYLRLTGLQRSDPAAARAEIARRTANDPDDFLGRWLEGAQLAHSPGDSSRAARILDTASHDRNAAGPQLTAGALLLTRGDVARGVAVCRGAADAYLARTRPQDAAHALIWPVVVAEERLEPEQVDDLIRRAEQIARASKDVSVLGDVLNVKASRVAQRDPRAAIAIRNEIQSMLQPLGPRFVLLANHRRLGLAMNRMGQLDQAEAHYTAAAALADTLGLFEAKSYCLSNLGALREQRGDFDAAAQLHREAVAAAEQSAVPAALAMTLTNLAGLQLTMGHYEQARPSYERALEIGRQARVSYSERLPAIDALAMLHRGSGRFDDALSLWQSLIDSCRTYHLEHMLSLVELHVAETHLDLGNVSLAREYTRDGLELARRFSNRAWEMYHLVFTTDLLLQSGEPEQALQTARRATAIARQADPHFLTATHHVTASALHALHRTDEAIALLDSVIAQFPAPADSSDLAQIVAWQGKLCLDDGQTPRSVQLLERALAIELSLGSSPPLEASVQIGLGRALLAAGKMEPAIQHLETGLAGFERLRDALGVAQERRQYVSAWYEGYVALACAQVRRGHPDRGLAVLERCRANQTRELFGGTPPGMAGRVPDALAQEAVIAQQELAAAQVAWVRVRALGEGGEVRHAAVLDARLDSLRAQWSDLEGRIARAAPAYARELDALPPATVGEVQHWLGGKRRLVAYLVGQQATLAFDVTGALLAVREVPWGERALARRIDAFVEALRGGDDAAARSLGTALADTLFLPDSLTAPAPEQLFVCADGPLHRLPFEAVPVLDRRGTSHYLIELCPVTYVTSATLLTASTAGGGRGPTGAKRPPAATRVIAFGDPTLASARGTDLAGAGRTRPDAPEGLSPLPNARREAEGLRALFRDARVFLGDEATEARFFDEATGARIIHVAAHAFVDDHHPGFSGIVLAATPAAATPSLADDGLVQADEVMQHALDAELVTLSACETGGGALLRGEGIVGLARAFRIAGAHNLVVSLWKVDDAATASLMQQFYEEIARGSAPTAALRAAKLAMLQGRVTVPPGESGSVRGVGRRSAAAGLASPAAWAPFVLFAGPARPEASPN